MLCSQLALAFCSVVLGAQLFLEKIISYRMAIRVSQINMSLSSMPPVHLHHSQVAYCWNLLDLGCLQIQVQLTSALNVFRACLHSLAKYSDIQADSEQPSSLSSRMFQKWLMPASVFPFLDYWLKALVKGRIFRKGWTSALGLALYSSCLELEGMQWPITSKEKPRWRGGSKLHNCMYFGNRTGGIMEWLRLERTIWIIWF